MHPTLNIALRAARIASEQIARATEKLEIIKSEQQSVADFITQVCEGAERTLAYHIHKTNPTHKVVGLHSGELAGEEPTDGSVEWFINPIDGLTNFAKGLPWYALTLVYREKGKAEHIVVINPVTGEEFTASRGRGAQFNGRRIRVSSATEFMGTTVALSQNGNSDKTTDNYLDLYAKISKLDCEIQNSGCAALNLAYVAAGRLEACCLLGIPASSLAPGQLLIQEAGGLIGNLTGEAKVEDGGNVITANPKLFKLLLRSIK